MSPSKSFHINTAHPWITISTKTDKSGPDRFLQFTKKWSVTIQKKNQILKKKQKPEKSSDKPENQAIHHFFIQNLDFKSKTAENRSTNRKNRPINRKNLLTFHFFPKFRKLNFVQKTDRFSQVSVKPVSCFQVDK
jgi:hypothetical protein